MTQIVSLYALKHDDSQSVRNLNQLKTLQSWTNYESTAIADPHVLMERDQEMELPPDLTFEQAMERLEAIVKNLEGDSCALEDALMQHAEGIALARFCMNRLNAAEMKIQNLTSD